MPIRRITIDFTAPPPVNRRLCGYIGEHNATELLIVPPAELTSDEVKHYMAAFETGGKVYHSRSFEPGEAIKIPLWQQLTAEQLLCVQLEARGADGELVAKSPMVYLALLPAARGAETEADYGSDGIAAEIAQNTKLRHEHDNKAVLDKLGTDGDSLTYDGQPIKGGGSSTQSDWQQSDPAAADYVKNRTHYETSSFKVTWDGSTEGRDTVYLFDMESDNGAVDKFYLVKVADDIAVPLAFESLMANDLAFNESGSTVSGTDVVGDFAIDKFNGGYMVAPYLVYCTANSAQLELAEFETAVTVTKGLWYVTGGSRYLESVSFPGSVKRLDKKYVPDIIKVDLAQQDKYIVITVTDRDGGTQSAALWYSKPQKGVDYWTDEDKQEVVKDVIAALPSWTGGDY